MSSNVLWVQLNCGPPWGFRLREEKGKYSPLLISRVNSKGRQQGLKEGDLVLSVNGQSTSGMTHADVQRVIRESPTDIELQLQRIVGNQGTNGISNGGHPSTQQTAASRLNVLEDGNSHAGVSSSDSTSTGSTTIHVLSHHSEDSSATESMWSPSRKRANLHLKLNNTTAPESPVTVTTESKHTVLETRSVRSVQDQEESSPVWQPFGAPYENKFRPVKLEVKSSKTTTTSATHNEMPNPSKEPEVTRLDSPRPTSTLLEREANPGSPINQTTENDTESHSTSAIFTKTGWSSHLPPSQSPTITLLQKAREGQLPKGAVYIEDKSDTTPIPKNAVLFDQKVIVEGDKIHTDSYYAVPTLTTESTTYDIKTPPKYDGIGPTEYGIPVGLRTGVKEEYASDWYKSMYKSLHRAKFLNDRPSQTVHLGGYMSEPEMERKDKLRTKYANDFRRKAEKSASSTAQTMSSDMSRVHAEPVVVRSEPKREAYRVEPRSIAEYEPGHSSLAEKEFNKFWSDFWNSMDDLNAFIGPTSPRPQHGLGKRWPNVLLSDGYESDSTLIRKTGRNPDVDPDQQKAWYKEIQKGGEIPLTGLRKTVPEKPAASQHQYQETQVNIHFKSPIRHLEKEYIEEEELRKRQEDSMRKLYEEERRKKHQQELAEIEMRRHSDFFTPSQKSPIALNRYDNPFEVSYSSNRLAPPASYRGPPPKTMARATYPFTAQTTRELSLNKGDIVYINKQIDKNWFEGEHHGLIGIFPVNYVEIIPNEKANLQPRKAIEGEALVKYNFRAQSPLELSLFKGEKVVLTRRMDHNWYEGRLGAKKGMFPVSYVQVLHEPGDHIQQSNRPISPRPPSSPVFSSIIVNGSHPKTQEGPSYNTGLRPLQNKPPLHTETKCFSQSLHIDTYNEPIPYRSLYAYKPQNDDELELKENDTVYVMEKCDDGWYVGTSLRTGLFGTFPGNYVERI